MTTFLGNPWFWVSVIIISAVTHYAMKLIPSMGGGGG